MNKSIFLFLLLPFASLGAKAQTTISVRDAAKHIGEQVTICDSVYNTKLMNNELTLMNVGANFPESPLTIVVKPEDRSKFKNKPDEFYKFKKICVTGTITEFKGKAQIVITEPKQIDAK